MSHEDARAYVEWLSDWSGQTYRLPSAAEWEYAARAWTAAPYLTGTSLKPVAANIARDKATPSSGPVAVGSYPANGFGLHDMMGNVAEWVSDCWIATLWISPTNGKPAVRRGDCSKRVVKDGAWMDDARYARVSARRQLAPDMALAGVGFRVVREMR